MKFFALNFFFLLTLVLHCIPAAAGTPRDTIPQKTAVDSFGVSYYTGEFYRKADRKEPYILDDFQKYSHHSFLGNIGQAETEYYALQPAQHTGFNYYKNDFASNLLFSDSVRYYDVHHPYTRLFFLAGQNKEALFSFIHSQNVNKNLNLTGYFNRIRSDGTYLHQATNLTSIYLSANYKSPNRGYYLLANIVYNVDKPQVNGGIQADSSLENADRPSDKKLLPVNLMNAQRQYMNRSVNVRQFFNLGRHSTPADSSELNVFTPGSSITYTLKASEESIVYSDAGTDSLFYINHFLHPAITRDSVNLMRLHNAVGWATLPEKSLGLKRKLGMFLNLENEWLRIYQAGKDTVFPNWMLRGSVFKYADSSSVFRSALGGEYILAGYNRNNYHADFKLSIALPGKSFVTGINAFVSDRKPNYMDLNYSSTNFRWVNTFSNEHINSLLAFIRSAKYSFELGAFDRYLQNTVYYDQNAQPRQSASGVYVLGGYIYKAFHFGNWTFANRITYQYSTDDIVIQFPELISEHSLYFRHAFKDKLVYQIGVDAFYFSSYYAKNYMPATGQFYDQYSSKIGNYPFIDLYFSMQIKTVRIFIKYEHINSGIPSSAYYFAPGYPAPDRALKFGLTWIFNN
jgi:hypothetical protein